MKRALGAMAANWLRKPENQQRIKRTARQLWSRFNDRKRTDTAPAQSAARPGTRPGTSPRPGGQDSSHGKVDDDPQR
ncbi:hypothetical protein [Salinisphaera aquimarina]|uniref:Uncharacterized protein n=1 Tax=Salinisphaera aquimarina TaxID=2094031 RepID=A0ABV7EHU4_9GAMM